MADGLGVARRACVGVADKLTNSDIGQHLEGLAAGKQVEIPAHRGKVVGPAEIGDEVNKPFSLTASIKVVMFADRVTQAVQVHYNERALPSGYDTHALGGTRATIGPLSSCSTYSPCTKEARWPQSLRLAR